MAGFFIATGLFCLAPISLRGQEVPPASIVLGSWSGQANLMVRLQRPTNRGDSTSVVSLNRDQLTYDVEVRNAACQPPDGPRVQLKLQASPAMVGTWGYTRTLLASSRAPFWTSRDDKCIRLPLDRVRGAMQITDRWFLTRPWETKSSAADALIIQSLSPQGPRPEVRVLDGATALSPRSVNGHVEIYPPATGANLTIEMSMAHTAVGPPPAGVLPPCEDCMPQSKDSSGVSIATLGDAMTAAGMPVVADRPGWTRIVTVLSRSALRERLVGHIQTVLTGCPVSAVFAIEPTHLCEPPIVRFLPEGVQVDVRIRPIQWGGGDTLWTNHRLLYPLRPLNSEVVFREPSHIETSAPLQASGSGYLDRLIGANPLALQPLTWELAVLHARRFGNACLFPDPSRAVFGELSGGADVLEVVFYAPVDAVPFESCQLPFPVEAARKPPG